MSDTSNPPSIRDIAEIAGVSVATVSRVLNKSPLSPCHPEASYFRNGSQRLTVQKTETYGSKARDLRCKSQ